MIAMPVMPACFTLMIVLLLFKIMHQELVLLLNFEIMQNSDRVGIPCAYLALSLVFITCSIVIK